MFEIIPEHKMFYNKDLALFCKAKHSDERNL